MLLFFILLVFGDNFEVGKDEFDVMYCDKQVIYSRAMEEYNSVKISFLGDSLLHLTEIRPKELLLVNKAINFRQDASMLFRIDLEKKYMGLADFVWPFIGFCILCAAISVRISQVILGLIDNYIGGLLLNKYKQRPLFCDIYN